MDSRVVSEMLRRVSVCAVMGASLLAGLSVKPARSDAAGDAEFFEKRVRPLLVENCFSCHSANAKPIQGGLRLDSKAGVTQGGARGAAVTVSAPEKSLLISALRGRSGVPQMPPKGRLPEAQIAVFEEWIKRGAVWPTSSPTASRPATAPFNLLERKAQHWAWQPIKRPAVPRIKYAKWVANPIDAFVLSKLEARGIKPAPEADRRTLIRRVTFDLIGLPPTPAEIEAFLKDRSANAYDKVVDRLLASPHYGERWGRHWLDLVRYAETYGHESDYEKPGAYQYRDYVIRALNADVPFDQFVQEHVAGDLLPKPRLNPESGFNESILGTGFWWLGEGTHSPVDLLQDEADRIDNQIDVFGKAFLGLTVGCARCHNHKFDAISTKDYYALSGILRSSRYQQTALDCPEKLQSSIDALDSLSERREAVLHRAAHRSEGTIAPPVPPGATLFADFSHDTYRDWSATGHAFGSGPRHDVLRTVGVGQNIEVHRISGSGIADSGFLSDKLYGVLRSPTFTIKNRHILYHLAGKGAEVRLIISGLQLIMDPIYGGLRIPVNGGDTLHWVTQDVGKWIGYRAYIELVDNGSGHLLADRILFSDGAPPEEPHIRTVGLAARPKLSETDLSELDAIDARRVQIEAEIPEPTRALAMAEGTGENDRVHIRGSYKTLGEEAPRKFLEALGGLSVPPAEGSGRLELARRMVTPSFDPLLPRVIVNRVWLHHFGEGIVRTPDDFGVMGQRPSHPELLDWLASEFTSTNHWSLKSLHRLMVLSSSYRMSSKTESKSEAVDPTDRLLHRMPVRRLEAEAIRDSILVVSGRLDPKMYGPSVMPYLSPYMEGRGRPSTSGSLDGDGRRTIYINIRRNFIPLFLLAFDYPTPFTCIGRRSVSNVPAQALAMMNNPFVQQQSEVWAKRILADSAASAEQRVTAMYEEAFGRQPDASEMAAAKAFLAQQPAATSPLQTWTDFCHALFNVKEFLFIR